MIELHSPRTNTPRARLVEGRFDLNASDGITTNVHQLDTERLAEKPWNIGLVVGPSGAGKSTVARAAFDRVIDGDYDWPETASILDGFPSGVSIDTITEALSSVGFSSPPAWVRPFHTLSNGEAFRATMARAIVAEPSPVVVDEFTSVVDRTVAQVGSYAIAKAVRRADKQFVAVTCHYDVLDWIQPDWVFHPHTGEFEWRSVQPRPSIELVVRPADVKRDWATFARHHYLSGSCSRGSRGVVVEIEGRPAGFAVTIAQPHPFKKKHRRVHRLVVIPDFQGLGLGPRMITWLGEEHARRGYSLSINTSHPGLIASLRKASEWRYYMAGFCDPHKGKVHVKTDRLISRFMYAGPASERLATIPVL